MMTENRRGIGQITPESPPVAGVITAPTPGFTSGKRVLRIC